MSPPVNASLRLACALSIIGTLLAGPALAQDDGQLLFETCRGCHSIEHYKNNYPTYKVPKLGGQHAQYVVDALKSYREDLRGHSTMHAQASTLSEDEMRALGSYLEGLADANAGDPRGTAPAQAATCVACHGQKGVGTAPNFPTLAGQHQDYLQQALTAYKSQQRQNAIMAGFAATLSEQDIEILAAYYASQQGLVTAK